MTPIYVDNILNKEQRHLNHKEKKEKKVTFYSYFLGG